MQCFHRTVLLVLTLIFCSVVLFYQLSGDPGQEGLAPAKPHNGSEEKQKIWASLGLCWGENFQGYGKSDFPYDRAAVYASRLWDSQTKSQVKVVVTIVTPSDDNTTNLLDYVSELERWGAKVVLQPSMWGNCVQQSQVTRMFAFLHPFIKPEDLVITADVDTFVIGDSVTNMLGVPSKVWVGEYIHTARTGGTIPMALVAMKASQWKESLDFSIRGIKPGMKEMVETFLKKDKGQNWGPWEVDQVILSHAIFRPDKQLCPLSRTNSLWSRLNLSPTVMEDEGSCHQGDLMNCHRQAQRKSCPWWHMLPSDREDYFRQIFNEITDLGHPKVFPMYRTDSIMWFIVFLVVMALFCLMGVIWVSCKKCKSRHEFSRLW